MNHREERDIQQWPEWDRAAVNLADIPADSERAIFYRQKNSHKGISSRFRLKKLKALQVNQAFLEEICALESLEYLELDTVTAEDIASISNLANLRTIKLANVRNARNFADLLRLPQLEKLFIENAKQLSNLEFLCEAHGLVSIGIEGSFWTKQKIDSLKPLSNLAALEALFMTSVQLKNKDLSCLSSCPRLKILECARFAPKEQFDMLRKQKPQLECSWCDRYDI